MLNKKGFTMVELLTVLVIIAILAAVAAPLYISNTQRAKASEAVAEIGLIRQAEREYNLSHKTYFDVTTDHVQKPFPPSVSITLADGTMSAADALLYGAEVDAGIPQYFSNAAYTVDAKGTTGTLSAPANTSSIFANPDPVDFLIKVDGGATVQCIAGTVTNCAIKGNEVGKGTPASTADDFILYMDNAGRAAVSYNGGTTFSAY